MSTAVTIREAFTHMTVVKGSVQQFRRFAEEVTETNVRGIAGFEYDIRTLHRGIVAILLALEAPLEDFVNLGLKLGTEEWENPPCSYEAALEQLDGIMSAVEELITSENEDLNVPGYREILEEQDLRVLEYLQRSFQALQALHAEIIPDAVRGADEEQINSLGEHIADHRDEGIVCCVCLDEIKQGKPIRFLPCSHRFHKRCIDGWLKINAICPIDRFRVFP